MPTTWLPFPASRNLVKSCHVALWEALAAEVMTVRGALLGMILAGKQGRERRSNKQKNNKKEKKEL